MGSRGTLGVVVALVSLLFASCSLAAAEPTSGELRPPQSPADLDTWVRQLDFENARDLAKVSRVCTIVNERLMSGADVYDKTIIYVVCSHRNIETKISLAGNAKNGSKIKQIDHPKTTKIISTLKQASKNRPDLYAWLHETQGAIYAAEGRDDAAIKEFSTAKELLGVLRLELAVRHVENLIALGSQYQTIKELRLADNAYFRAMCYPFYLLGEEMVADKTGLSSRRLREAHCRAIEGLLFLRRGNVRALRDLKVRLIPAMAPKYGPLIDAAIADAGPQAQDKQ